MPQAPRRRDRHHQRFSLGSMIFDFNLFLFFYDFGASSFRVSGSRDLGFGVFVDVFLQDPETLNPKS